VMQGSSVQQDMDHDCLPTKAGAFPSVPIGLPSQAPFPMTSSAFPISCWLLPSRGSKSPIRLPNDQKQRNSTTAAHRTLRDSAAPDSETYQNAGQSQMDSTYPERH